MRKRICLCLREGAKAWEMDYGKEVKRGLGGEKWKDRLQMARHGYRAMQHPLDSIHAEIKEVKHYYNHVIA